MQKIFNGIIFNEIKFIGLAFILLLVQSNYCFNQDSESEQYKIRTIVIDPGHGGKDPGSMGKFAKEKDVALAISLKAGKYIEKYFPEVEVIYTRKTDVFIELHERARIANDTNADLFISVHVDGHDKPTAYGTSTLVLGLHRAEENFEVAKRENSVILLEDDYTTNYQNFDPNSPESYIIFSLMQNIYFDQSINFAQMVQNQFRERARRKDRGVRQQGLLVLAQTSMPGVLVETGYMTNEKEEKYLTSDYGQDLIASAIFRAFRSYKLYIEDSSPMLAIDENNNLPDNSIKVPDEEKVIDKNPELTDTENNKKPAKKDNLNQTKKSTDNNVEFKVQILSSSSKIDIENELFKDYNDIQEFNSNGRYKYLVGSKSDYEEAVEFSKWVKSRHPDAFIVAICKGKIIPLQEALKLINAN